MLKDVVEAKPLAPYRIYLRFEDGVEGEVDIAALVPLDGVFAALRDPEFFAAVAVQPELGTIAWPNGADLDPDVLYARLTGRTIVFPDESLAASPWDT
jgi:hypothetical protein